MPNLTQTLTTAQKAAHAAGERVLQGFAEPISFESKGDVADRVTQVDLDCQKIIREHLAGEFPDIPFLGEEDRIMLSGVAPDRASSPPSASLRAPLSMTRGRHGDEARWIVDPLDGTMNFTHRLPFCGVSIALEENGEVVLGVIHFPMLGWDFSATKDGGAEKNDEKIKVSDCKKFEDAIIAEIYSDREARGKDVRYPPSAAFRKFGSAVTSLALLAEGAVDGVVLRCRKWDVAAAEVIVKEAGGKVSIKMDDPEDPRSSLTCVAAVPAIHEELQNLVQKVA